MKKLVFMIVPTITIRIHCTAKIANDFEELNKEENLHVGGGGGGFGGTWDYRWYFNDAAKAGKAIAWLRERGTEAMSEDELHEPLIVKAGPKVGIGADELRSIPWDPAPANVTCLYCERSTSLKLYSDPKVGDRFWCSACYAYGLMTDPDAPRVGAATLAPSADPVPGARAAACSLEPAAAIPEEPLR